MKTEEIKIVEVKKGDMLVLRHPGRISKVAKARLQRHFKMLCDANEFEVRAPVLEEGLEVFTREMQTETDDPDYEPIILRNVD